ncbi:major facilitator superfamily domain-containing protein 9-like [Ischnura elegans]|uniref:major facilitator superfamily domain-containing protein 9-like n=1 Tax=Ischnura elegans TaxID=197161 RepID=UPI001ED8969D|nr:major facilitator superfamily domain-containing protein 9-like [Ischnura elegans]
MARLDNVLFFISFLDLFAASLTVPLLSGHIKALGASHALIGLVSSTYAVLQFFSGPVVGSWSDIKGRRTILLLTLICCSLCYLSLGFAINILTIICIRVVLGTLKHTQSLCRAILSDVVPPETLTEVFGRYNAISGIGFIIGPVIGGHLAEYQHGFFYVCCLSSIIFIINLCIALIFIPKSKQRNKNEGQRMEASLWGSISMAVNHLRYMNWSLYWDAFSLKAMLAFSVSILYANYSLTLQERFDLTPSAIGYSISFQSLLGAVSGFGAGAVSKIYGTELAKLTQHGFILLAISFIIILSCSALWLFILALAPLAISSSILRTALSQWSLEQAPKDQRGSVIGAQHSLSAISRMTAPVIAGVAQSTFGPSGPVLISLLASLAGIVIASRIHRKSKAVEGSNKKSL